MTQLISSFSGNTVHISTGTGTTNIQTLCGRKFNVARTGYSIHHKECPKCAALKSFTEAIEDAMNEYKANEAARAEKRVAAIARDKRVLEAHRKTTAEIINILRSAGIDVTSEEKPAGMKATFSKDGFCFTLRGNVHDGDGC